MCKAIYICVALWTAVCFCVCMYVRSFMSVQCACVWRLSEFMHKYKRTCIAELFHPKSARVCICVRAYAREQHYWIEFLCRMNAIWLFAFFKSPRARHIHTRCETRERERLKLQHAFQSIPLISFGLCASVRTLLYWNAHRLTCTQAHAYKHNSLSPNIDTCLCKRYFPYSLVAFQARDGIWDLLEKL